MTLDEKKAKSDDTSEQVKTRKDDPENNCSRNAKAEEREGQEDESVTYFKERVVNIEKSLESLVDRTNEVHCNDHRDATGHGINLLQLCFPSD